MVSENIINQIDYCLGCRRDSHKELKKLAGWEFCLTFDIDGKEHNSRYLRIPKEGYLDWKKYKKREDEHISLLLNSFLLGLDVSLIISKIKEEINKIENSRKLLKTCRRYVAFMKSY